jgi:hypothetical protein
MSNDAQDGFDPRFDAAFQRGFDGPVTDAPPMSKLTATQSDVERAAPIVAIDGDDPSFVAADDPNQVQPRKLNPFLVALGVLSVALIVGGIWAAQFARESFLTVNLSTDIDYVTLQMVIFGAPLAIAIGIATAVGLLFILAQRWRRGRSN